MSAASNAGVQATMSPVPKAPDVNSFGLCDKKRKGILFYQKPLRRRRSLAIRFCKKRELMYRCVERKSASVLQIE